MATSTEIRRLIPWHIRASWGISEINDKGGKIAFRVNGKKYTGPVCITAKRNTFTVAMCNDVFTTGKMNLCRELDSRIES